METRANHVLIGTFTIAVLLGALGFALWLAKIQIDQKFTLYDVFFEGSVAGLSVAGDVRYQGVRVGRVNAIAIDDTDPSRVRVRIEVDAKTPVSAKSTASLEFFGVTGVLYVQISAGDSNAPPLLPKPGKKVAVIAAQKSSIEELFAGAPLLLENAVVLVNRLSSLINSDNRETITDILVNFEAISGSFANRGDEIEGLLVNAHAMSNELTQVAKNLKVLSNRFDGIAGEAETTLHTVNGVLDTDLRAFLREGRQLVVSLERVTQRVESDPARFFLGTSASEYRAE